MLQLIGVGVIRVVLPIKVADQLPQAVQLRVPSQVAQQWRGAAVKFQPRERGVVGQGAGGDVIFFEKADGDDAGAPQRLQVGADVLAPEFPCPADVDVPCSSSCICVFLAELPASAQR